MVKLSDLNHRDSISGHNIRKYVVQVCPEKKEVERMKLECIKGFRAALSLFGVKLQGEPQQPMTLSHSYTL